MINHPDSAFALVLNLKDVGCEAFILLEKQLKCEAFMSLHSLYEQSVLYSLLTEWEVSAGIYSPQPFPY